MATTITPAQTKAALQFAIAVSQVIHDAGEIPSGTLYAALCGKIDLATYDAMIRTLKRTGLVEETPAKLLRWAGPKVPKGGA